MKQWTRHHQALLEATRASAIIPPLYARLSLERFHPADDEIRRLRDWATSLRGDPGWTVLRAALDVPAAWPQAWTEAVDAGFSPRTDHHHALLFGEFADRFVEASDYEAATLAWRRSVRAWERVFRSGYADELFEIVGGELASREPHLLAEMLGPLVRPRTEELRRAAGLHPERQHPEVDARLARFALGALRVLSGASGHPALEHAAGLARNSIATVAVEVVRRFEQLGEDHDLSTVSGAEVLARYAWIDDYFRIADLTEGASIAVVTAATDEGWALRRLGRDDDPFFDDIFVRAARFNDDLEERLRSFESAFGQNSKCADFLVFVGEVERNLEDRKATFRRGLTVCPGHRNSAMLLAHVLVREAEATVAQSALTPALVTKSSLAKERVGVQLREAWEKLREAESVYAFDEALPDVKRQVSEEANRLGVDLPSWEEEG